MSIENIVEICVAIDIAIFGLAYPLMIDRLTQIGLRYRSEYLPVLFNLTYPQRRVVISWPWKVRMNTSYFKLSIIAVLASFLFLIFQFPPPKGWDIALINNSAKILVFFLTINLVIHFLIWIDKIVLYTGSAHKLLRHLITDFKSAEENTDTWHYRLKTINELTIYALSQQDEHLQETIRKFYFDLFSTIRRESDDSEGVHYPIELYQLVYRLCNESVELERNKLRSIEHRAVSGNWFIGEGFIDTPISETTYSWMWRSLIVLSQKSRFVKMFWSNSSQYFELELGPHSHLFHSPVPENSQIPRESRKERFLEFHYALGGLLYFQEQYSTIGYIFEFSQSFPPKQVLLPSTMDEAMSWFHVFSDEFNDFDLKYSFPGIDNLGQTQMQHWVCLYISTLLVRQYFRQSRSTQAFTTVHSLPDDISELHQWRDKLPYLTKCLTEVVENKKLLEPLGFNELVQEKKGVILTFPSILNNRIDEKITVQQIQAELSVDKIQSFKEKSKEIMVKTFKHYNDIFQPEVEEQEPLQISIRGVRVLSSKSDFIENAIPVLNFSTIFGQQGAMKVKQLIPRSFALARTKRYLFKKEELGAVLKKVIHSVSDFSIVGFNLTPDLEHHLKKGSYQSEVQLFDASAPDMLNTLYVLKKSDRPWISYDELESKEKEDWHLEELSNEFHVYSSVIDLSNPKNETLRPQTYDEKEPKVLVTIAFHAIINWMKNRDVVQIDIASDYREQGIESSMDDIEPLKP